VTTERARVTVISSSGAENQAGRAKLVSLLKHELGAVPEQERAQLVAVLEKYHDVFSLAEGERGDGFDRDSHQYWRGDTQETTCDNSSTLSLAGGCEAAQADAR